MRDHNRLQAFQLADAMALLVYRATQAFPKSKVFGLSGQMRRAAVSAASNIVEGCARSTQKDYVHFLDIALGSVREVDYQASLAHRLGMLQDAQYMPLHEHCQQTSRVLCSLILSVRDPRRASASEGN